MRDLNKGSECGISMLDLNLESRCGISMRNLHSFANTPADLGMDQGPLENQTLRHNPNFYGTMCA